MQYYKTILVLTNFRKNTYKCWDKMLAHTYFASESTSVAKCALKAIRESEVSNSSTD
jgi:hypothetical protein